MSLLTPAQAASELGISGKQLRLLTGDGAIPFTDIGRGDRPIRRYEPDDIEAFKLARRKVECRSTNAKARTRTPTTSGFHVIDIAAERAKLRNAKQSALKR